MNGEITQVRRQSRGPGARLFFGLFVIGLGLVFLLDNFGLIRKDDYLQYWPLLLVAFGLTRLSMGTCTSDRMWGGLWVFVGGWLLLNELGYVDFSIGRLWPLFLIFFGVSLVLRATGRAGTAFHKQGSDAGDRLNAFALWSGVVRRCTSQTFQGGEATAIMGGCEIDLRQTTPAGGAATVDLFALWGGIDLFVPGDWTVRNEAVALLGGVDDTRRDTAGDPAKVLVVRGYAIMGGIEIKN